MKPIQNSFFGFSNSPAHLCHGGGGIFDCHGTTNLYIGVNKNWNQQLHEANGLPKSSNLANFTFDWHIHSNRPCLQIFSTFNFDWLFIFMNSSLMSNEYSKHFCSQNFFGTYHIWIAFYFHLWPISCMKSFSFLWTGFLFEINLSSILDGLLQISLLDGGLFKDTILFFMSF